MNEVQKIVESIGGLNKPISIKTYVDFDLVKILKLVGFSLGGILLIKYL